MHTAADHRRYLHACADAVRTLLEAFFHHAARERGPGGAVASRYAVAADEVVRVLCDRDRTERASIDRAARAWAEIDGAARTLALPRLAERLGLGDVERRIIAVLGALEHDPALERACTYAWDDFTRKRPDVGFLTLLLGCGGVEPAAVAAALEPHAPLCRWRLVRVGSSEDDDAVSPGRRVVRLASRTIAHLDGRDALDPSLEGIAALVEPAPDRDAILPAGVLLLLRRALNRSDSRTPVLLHGPAGVGKTLAVRAIAAELDRPLIVVDTSELMQARDSREQLARLGREVAMHGAMVLFRNRDDLSDDRSSIGERFAALSCALPGQVVYSARRRPRYLVRAIPELCEIPVVPPDIAARAALWRRALDGDIEPVCDADIDEIAGRFTLGGEAIARAGRRAVALARLRSPERPRVALDDLTASARIMLHHHLGTVARRIEPGFEWDDLVLPHDTMEVIDELLAFARHRSHLLESWGFARKLPYGRGVSAVMSGPPGTGKTMVAQLLARQLGCDLYLIELAQVVNKYVGETEKSLARVFDEAEGSHAILFFDEADALFAKRTDVKSSNDRYANLEVNYLLQRMETYNGITLLATNLEHGLDEAFKRRVRFAIPFEMPEPDVRERLWRSMIPVEAPLAADIDWPRLATRWEMAGGHIKKAVVRAAARAIARGRDAVITGDDLAYAAQLEYREMGRIA